MATLDELESSFENILGKVGPSVVRLGGWRGGAGVVVGDGTVLTNAHNVRGDSAVVTFADGRQAEATLAGVDVDGDLAVLTVDTAGAPAVEWSERSATIGTAAFAVTTNGSGNRATFGFVSSVARSFRGPRGRRISGSIEHTAPLAPGSSGSPLVDRDGRLSVSTPIASATAFTWPCRRMPRSRTGSQRSVAASQQSGRCSAWVSHRRGSRTGCAARSAWPSTTASSFVRSKMAVRRRRPASAKAT